MIETHSAELETECLEFLRARAYTCNVIKNAWWRITIPERRPIDHNRWLWASKD